MLKKPPHPVDEHVGGLVRTRRLMLAMSQVKLGEALGITFQQIQKYESGYNRISASKLQQISQILTVPIEFFFDDVPQVDRLPKLVGHALSPDYVSAFLATSEGLALVKAFVTIKDPILRRRIVDLVKEIAGDE